jgi:hypothetical protein
VEDSLKGSSNRRAFRHSTAHHAASRLTKNHVVTNITLPTSLPTRNTPTTTTKHLPTSLRSLHEQQNTCATPRIPTNLNKKCLSLDWTLAHKMRSS